MQLQLHSVQRPRIKAARIYQSSDDVLSHFNLVKQLGNGYMPKLTKSTDSSRHRATSGVHPNHDAQDCQPDEWELYKSSGTVRFTQSLRRTPQPNRGHMRVVTHAFELFLCPLVSEPRSFESMSRTLERPCSYGS